MNLDEETLTSNCHTQFPRVVRMMFIILLLTLLKNNAAYSNHHITLERTYKKHFLENPKPKLYIADAENFLGFKIPDSSFLRHYAKIEFNGVDRVLKICPVSLNKSIVIAQSDTKLLFGEIEIATKTLTSKSTFNIDDKEEMEMILLKGSKLHIYSSVRKKYAKATIIEREFDTSGFVHTATRVLLTTIKEEQFDSKDIIPDDISKVTIPSKATFAGRNTDIEYASASILVSEDSSRVLVSFNVNDNERQRYMFAAEYVFGTNDIYSYSFFWEGKGLPGFKNTYTTGSMFLIDKVFANVNGVYRSNRLYLMNEGKVDSIDYNFSPCIKDFPNPQDIKIGVDQKPLLNNGYTIELLYSIHNQKDQIIGIAKAELEIKQKKVMFLNCARIDGEFGKKYGLGKEISGEIRNSTGYTGNGAIVVVIEAIETQRSQISGISRGKTHGPYYMLCFRKDMSCKWVYSNQERWINSTNMNYLTAFSCTEYNNTGIFLTTIDDKPQKGLWVYQIDSETGKLVKKQMAVSFPGSAIFPTDCLKYSNGKYHVFAQTDFPDTIQILERK